MRNQSNFYFFFPTSMYPLDNFTPTIIWILFSNFCSFKAIPSIFTFSNISQLLEFSVINFYTSESYCTKIVSKIWDINLCYNFFFNLINVSRLGVGHATWFHFIIKFIYTLTLKLLVSTNFVSKIYLSLFYTKPISKYSETGVISKKWKFNNF